MTPSIVDAFQKSKTPLKDAENILHLQKGLYDLLIHVDTYCVPICGASCPVYENCFFRKYYLHKEAEAK